MTRRTKRALIGVTFAVSGLAALLVANPGVLLEALEFYVRFFTESEVYESGTAYGVTIGQTKEEAIVGLYDHFADQKVYLGLCKYIDESECPTLYRITAHDDFTGENVWYLSFIYGCCDSLKLYFEEGRLIRIWRHWSPGGLP